MQYSAILLRRICWVDQLPALSVALGSVVLHAHRRSRRPFTRVDRWGLFALSFLLAWLTYKLIEKPIRLGGNSIIKPVCLGVSLAIIGYAGFEIFQTGGFPSRFQKDYLARIQDVTSDTDAPFSYAKCPVWLSFSSVDLEFMVLAKEKAATAVIWGDSHAEHFFPGRCKKRWGPKLVARW